MKIFAGRYSWDGKKHDEKEPIAWFPGAYDLKIFDLTRQESGITHLKPYLCIYSQTGEGISISANPEKFVRRICDEFSLEIDRVLWAEELKNHSLAYEVVVFTRGRRLGELYFYSMDKRQPLAGERRIIEKALAGLH
ncbi:MAG: hypothetical protein ACK5PS_05420 [Desulfopila sp.]